MIRVLVVDDQELIRAGLRVIIEAHPELTVAAEAGDGITALTVLDDVDVVLLDLRMPGIDGVEVTRRIRATPDYSRLPVLVLTTFDQDEHVVAALSAGADGFFSKGAGPEELTAGILRVASGGRALSPTAVDAVVGHLNAGRPAPPTDPATSLLFEQLTPREREIVALVVDGLDNGTIAAQMVLSPFTVKTHVNRAMMKVGARDRAQLVSFAIRAGGVG